MKIRTLLVDDEYLALDLLEEFLSRVSGFHIVAKLESPLEALRILQSEPIDLMFLDIQMPVLSGSNLLRSLPQPPATIFTTAYDEYAVEAFELNVIDYLRKPFSFDRFAQAVHKATLHLKRQDEESALLASSTSSKEYLTLKMEGKLVRVNFSELLYIEGLREYVKVVTTRGNYVVLESLKNLSAKLPEDQFMRIHKSYIASLDKIEALEGSSLVVAGFSIPVSRDRKQELIDRSF